MTRFARWKRAFCTVAVLVGFGGLSAQRAGAGAPPAQRLPSALLVYPLIDTTSGRDTQIELVNLSGDPQDVQCFYVYGDTLCSEIGFVVSLTPYQPMAWLASAGVNNTLTGSAAPPFFGTGELTCAVVPPRPELQYHNAIQGRAAVFDTTGLTVSYAAVGFRRLTAGDFTGVVALNGSTYAYCPDKLHFDVLTDQPSATSQMILVPCSQDLLMQVPTSMAVQYLIINEFEQTFSTSLSITCFDQRALGDITDSLVRTTIGTDTAHVIVRGTKGPLLGLVIDTLSSPPGTAGNEPSYQGGRSATVMFP
jgi:hypothetical protein